MTKNLAILDEVVMKKIYLIRGQKVILDKDLAELYNVTTGNLNKAVKRNLLRFPEDFMFQLTDKEFKNLIFQNGTSSWGGTRRMPYAFTEQGVAMLSSAHAAFSPADRADLPRVSSDQVCEHQNLICVNLRETANCDIKKAGVAEGTRLLLLTKMIRKTGGHKLSFPVPD